MPRHLRTGLLALALACSALVHVARPAGAVTVTVEPADTTVNQGDTFLIRVVTDDFPDLKAYHLIFHYTPVILEYQQPIAGDVLTGTGRPYTMQSVPDVTPPPDSAWVDCAQLEGSTSGPGVLVYFQFKAPVVGISNIDCLEVDFRDSQNNQTIPNCVGGQVRVVGPVPVKPTSWGKIKTIYR